MIPVAEISVERIPIYLGLRSHIEALQRPMNALNIICLALNKTLNDLKSLIDANKSVPAGMAPLPSPISDAHHFIYQ